MSNNDTSFNNNDWPPLIFNPSSDGSSDIFQQVHKLSPRSATREITTHQNMNTSQSVVTGPSPVILSSPPTSLATSNQNFFLPGPPCDFRQIPKQKRSPTLPPVSVDRTLVQGTERNFEVKLPSVQDILKASDLDHK